jgi:hypothetical protein
MTATIPTPSTPAPQPFDVDDQPIGLDDDNYSIDDPPRPSVWADLTSDEAEYEWLVLNQWVEDYRRWFSVPATIIPPYWHRHRLLVEHLSALRTHWLAAYDPAQHGSAPFGWLRDLDEWKNRMREAVATLGCRIDTCRPEKPARWPGEPTRQPDDPMPPVNLDDRYDDFVTVVLWDVTRRQQAEQHSLETLFEAESPVGTD